MFSEDLIKREKLSNYHPMPMSEDCCIAAVYFVAILMRNFE